MWKFFKILYYTFCIFGNNIWYRASMLSSKQYRTHTTVLDNSVCTANILKKVYHIYTYWNNIGICHAKDVVQFTTLFVGCRGMYELSLITKSLLQQNKFCNECLSRTSSLRVGIDTVHDNGMNLYRSSLYKARRGWGACD